MFHDHAAWPTASAITFPALNTLALRTPRALTPTIRRSPVIAACSIGAALERVRCHALSLDGVCAGTNNAVAAVDSWREAGHACASVGAAGACLEVGRIYGGDGGDEEEEGGFKLHFGGGLGRGSWLASGQWGGGMGGVLGWTAGSVELVSFGVYNDTAFT
ncbi:hypothetical protein V492_05633 [Pseudogymnoascus sp. VKM F-4246]|nr:hypothetical protein V492_05633 [Pseudogymnoascus sp. VKM F-4246]